MYYVKCMLFLQTKFICIHVIPLGDVAVVIITGGLLPAPFEAMIVIV